MVFQAGHSQHNPQRPQNTHARPQGGNRYVPCPGLRSGVPVILTLTHLSSSDLLFHSPHGCHQPPRAVPFPLVFLCPSLFLPPGPHLHLPPVLFEVKKHLWYSINYFARVDDKNKM